MTEWIVMGRADPAPMPGSHGVVTETWRKAGACPIYADTAEDALLVASRQIENMVEGQYLVVANEHLHRHTLQASRDFHVV